MTESDIKSVLRDLFYLQEEAFNLVKQVHCDVQKKQRILDNLNEKQVILTKMIQFFNH